jgi:hypothetical protein
MTSIEWHAFCSSECMVQKMKEEKMKEKKNFQKVFSTCLEDPRCAEMMQKLMSRNGSCTECEGIMRSMMEKCFGNKKETKETNEEKSHA